jgi:glutathione synthase/RimK-type ligase-like ATP-grasp enzyme
MHSPEYITLIEEQAKELGIEIRHYAEKWAMELRLNSSKKFIVGYTFPLNNSACYKIIRNKNLCAEVLQENNVPVVPHDVLYSPTHLDKHHDFRGNSELIAEYIKKYNYPLVIKKNNTTKGQGVFIAKNATQLEKILAFVFTTEAAVSISPYRESIREFRNVILDGKCLLTYEKHIPCVIGDGVKTLIELLSDYVQANPSILNKKGRLFDPAIFKQITYIPEVGENLYLEWKHNRLKGSTYTMVEDDFLSALAIKAAIAVDARFVTVDIIKSEKFGLEVMEINASVGIHYTFADRGSFEYQMASGIYRKAIKKVFELD